MRAALFVAVAAFAAALGFYELTIPEKIAAFGVFGAVRSAFYIGLLVGSVTYAGLKGGGPERAVAAVLATRFVLDPLMHLYLHARFTTVDPTHLILDSATLIAFVAVALRANRFWTLWLCAFHGLAVLSHVTKALDLTIHPVVYAIMEAMWSYMLLALLIWGTWVHQRRLTTQAGDRSWRDSSHRSARVQTPPSND
jgi:hypothetical protein